MPKILQKKISSKKQILFLLLAIILLIANIFLAWQFHGFVSNEIGLAIMFDVVLEGLLIVVIAFFYWRSLSIEKKVTEELELAKIKIEREQAKDEALLNSIGDGVVATDQSGVIIFINNVAQELLSWTKDVIGEKLSEVSLLADSNGSHLTVDKHPLHLSLLTKKQVVTKDYHFVRKDKVDLAVYICATPVLLKGELVGAIEVFRDITKEKEIDQAKSEFVSLASHQMRTPLSTVSWYAEMLLDGDAGAINDEQKKYLQEIYDSNKRMTDLVNCLLNVSRIEMGTFMVNPTDIKIQEIADSLLQELAIQIETRQLKIIKEYEEDLPVIKADPNLIRIILQNILSNAVKYTAPEGFVKVEIFTRPHDIMIKVEDNGYGIPKEQQEKIFNKLFRADNVKDKVTDGNGLGLYIAKSIVEQSGGKIWFESVENKGTTFFVTLPLKIQKKQGSKMLSAY